MFELNLFQATLSLKMNSLAFLLLILSFTDGRRYLSLQIKSSYQVETTKKELEHHTETASFTNKNLDTVQTSTGLASSSALKEDSYNEALTNPNTIKSDSIYLETPTVGKDESREVFRDEQVKVSKNRHHFLRRRINQSCSIQCFDSADCSKWASSWPSCISYQICKSVKSVSS